MMLAAIWPAWEADLPRNLVKAGVTMSGLFDLGPVRYIDFAQPDLKLTEQDARILSPAWMPQSHAAPFLTAVGGLESDEFKRQSKLLANKWKPNHRGDVALPGVNHMTICDAFATPGNPLFEATIALLTDIEQSTMPDAA